MLVLQAGDIVFEAYRNDMSASTRHIMMSVSKSVTSLLVGMFVGKGQIRLDEPVTTYRPRAGQLGLQRRDDPASARYGSVHAVARGLRRPKR